MMFFEWEEIIKHLEIYKSRKVRICLVGSEELCPLITGIFEARYVNREIIEFFFKNSNEKYVHAFDIREQGFNLRKMIFFTEVEEIEIAKAYTRF